MLLNVLCLLNVAVSAWASKPNIVLILTDDQDVSTLSRRFLPRIYEHLVDEGVLYENFFAPVSICCPSRVSLLRTQYAHNHNITFVSKPWGGWDVFNRYGYVNHTLPDHLQAVGYDTFYVGKYMNDHTEDNCESLPVSGFTSSDILVDPYTYDYWNPGFSRDNGPVNVHKGEYSTDLVRDKSLAYLDDALESTKPFFLGIAPIASHSWIDSTTRADPSNPNAKLIMNIPSPHPRHANLFASEQIPRTVSFNPDTPQGVSWVRTLPKLNSTQEAYLDEFYRGRLRVLQAVDELVEQVVQRLTKAGQLDNTYIFYTSDNGYALGTHRRQPGKTLGFEEDIHVPLIVRGPGVAASKIDTLSSYGIVDLSRTILDIAGAKTGYQDDGVKINLHQGANERHSLARHSISEYWVLGVDEGIYTGGLRTNNTYRTLRVHDEVDGQAVTVSYSVWCTGERELYDLVLDPHQVNNLLADLNEAGRFAPFDSTINGTSIVPVHLQKRLDRLDALLLILKTCVGETCTNPHAALFKNGGVKSFAQASEPQYDEFFASIPKVRFKECALGFQSRLEKPEWRDEWAYDEWGMGPALVVQA